MEKTFLPQVAGVLEAVEMSLDDSFSEGDLTIEPIMASHDPVFPAYGYKISYKGKKVVVSGDSLFSEEMGKASQDADLLLHDALSEPLLDAFIEVTEKVGNARLHKILVDVTDYHAGVEDIIKGREKFNIFRVGLYHLVPTPTNSLVKNIFGDQLPSEVFLVEDRMVFDFDPEQQGFSVGKL